MNQSVLIILGFLVAVAGAYAFGWRGGMDWRDAQSRVRDENIGERLRDHLLLAELELALVERYQKTAEAAAYLVVSNQKVLAKRYARGETNVQVLQEWFDADAILK